MSGTASFISKLEKAGIFAEDALLIFILVGMVLLAGTQILLRNFFDYSLFWGDEMLRLMVLWLTVAGGLAASRVGRHISLEVLDRFLPASLKLVTQIIIDLFTAVVCALFSWHSALFVIGSYQFGDTVMNGTPAWMLQIILPVGFGLMAYRHLVWVIKRPFESAHNDDA